MLFRSPVPQMSLFLRGLRGLRPLSVHTLSPMIASAALTPYNTLHWTSFCIKFKNEAGSKSHQSFKVTEHIQEDEHAHTRGMQPARPRVWEILWANKFASSKINRKRSMEWRSQRGWTERIHRVKET